MRRRPCDGDIQVSDLDSGIAAAAEGKLDFRRQRRQRFAHDMGDVRLSKRTLRPRRRRLLTMPRGGTKQHLWNDRQGLAAVEFALILPIMLSMLLGLTELSQALACRAAVTNMASTGADLVAQETSASSTDLDNVFNALNAMLYGFFTSSASIE